VLSKSTEATDRGAKWSIYQKLDSVQFHAVVDQYRLLVETNTRVEGVWEKRDLQARDQRLEIPALGFSMTLDEIYDGVIELERLGRS
jgi:Uma2 family endonuclease